MTDLVVLARDLAYRAHAGQVDKAGRPYIEHVARVAAAVSDDPVAEAVAWCHDIIEDCPHIAGAALRFLTEDQHEALVCLSRNMCRTNAQYYRWINRNPLALRIKLADIADNSNEERLALLDEATAGRLRRKYAKARKALGATG